MAKALPLKLWLELEDSVAHHKAEVTKAFAEARKRLLPEPAPWQSELTPVGCATPEDIRRHFQMQQASSNLYNGLYNNAAALGALQSGLLPGWGQW